MTEVYYLCLMADRVGRSLNIYMLSKKLLLLFLLFSFFLTLKYRLHVRGKLLGVPGAALLHAMKSVEGELIIFTQSLLLSDATGDS